MSDKSWGRMFEGLAYITVLALIGLVAWFVAEIAGIGIGILAALILILLVLVFAGLN